MTVDKIALNRGFKIAVGSDHAGGELALALVNHLQAVGNNGHVCTVFVPPEGTIWDYPDPAQSVAKLVASGEVDRGLLICGTGIGVSIAANRFAGVRCALVHTVETAVLSRQHNDANVIALGAYQIDRDLAWQIVHTWLRTPFAHGRHATIINKIEIPHDT